MTVPASCVLVQPNLSIVIVVVIRLRATHAQVVSRVVQCLSGVCADLQTGFVVALFWPSACLLTAPESATQSIKTQTHNNTHIRHPPAQE